MSRSGGGGGGGSLSMRWAQMAHQKEVIEERKRLYMAKRNKETSTSASPVNAFSNDGSFLDNFKKMSRQIPAPEPMNLHAIPPPSPICLTRIPKPKELDPCSIPRPPSKQVFSADTLALMEATAEQVALNGDSWEITLKSQSARAEALWFLRDEDSTDYKYYRSLVSKYRDACPDVKCKTEDANVEEKYEPEFSLRDDSSSDESNDIKSVPPVKMHFEKVKTEPKDLNLNVSAKVKEKLDCVSDSEDDGKRERAKKRKSRWGETDDGSQAKNIGVPGVAPEMNLEAETVAINLPTCSTPIVHSNVPQKHDPGLIQYAIKTYGNANLSDEDWKKCEDNYKISILYQEMLHKRNEIEKLKAAGRFKYEYDSDEEIDENGTWEHRLRQQEMEATQRWANELTRQASGKHHIGDFLPPDELQKFMEKYSSVKSGKEPDLSDYKEFKLKEDNIGFKMLQKLGWTEGEGLGADKSGIVEPVNKTIQRDSSEGLGVEKVDLLAEGDDEFDAYRKRMMLAYRFRPNPLNNPRRPYY